MFCAYESISYQKTSTVYMIIDMQAFLSFVKMPQSTTNCSNLKLLSLM